MFGILGDFFDFLLDLWAFGPTREERKEMKKTIKDSWNQMKEDVRKDLESKRKK